MNSSNNQLFGITVGKPVLQAVGWRLQVSILIFIKSASNVVHKDEKLLISFQTTSHETWKYLHFKKLNLLNPNESKSIKQHVTAKNYSFPCYRVWTNFKCYANPDAVLVESLTCVSSKIRFKPTSSKKLPVL